jgi:hypothetical protein
VSVLFCHVRRELKTSGRTRSPRLLETEEAHWTERLTLDTHDIHLKDTATHTDNRKNNRGKTLIKLLPLNRKNKQEISKRGVCEHEAKPRFPLGKESGAYYC